MDTLNSFWQRKRETNNRFQSNKNMISTNAQTCRDRRDFFNLRRRIKFSPVKYLGFQNMLYWQSWRINKLIKNPMQRRYNTFAEELNKLRKGQLPRCF